MTAKKLVLSFLSAVLISLVTGGMFFSLFERQKVLQEEIGKLRAELADEKDARTDTLKKIDLNQQILFRNLNESRDVLRLPGTKALTVFPENEIASEEGKSAENSPSGYEGFFRGISFFSDFYLTRDLARKMELLLKNAALTKIFEKNGLLLEQKEKTVYLLRHGDGEEEVRFLIQGRYDERMPVLRISSFLQKEENLSLQENQNQLIRQIENFLSSETGRISVIEKDHRRRVEELTSLIAEPEIKAILAERELEIDVPASYAPGHTYTMEIRRKSDGENSPEVLLLSGVRFPGNYFFAGSEIFEGAEEFSEGLKHRLRSIDTRNEQELKVDQALEGLEKLSRDPAFVAYLKEHKMVMSESPREDGDYYYFDLFLRQEKPAGTRAIKYGAFAVLKKYGEVYLADEEDLIISSIRAIESASRIGVRNTESFFRNGENLQEAGELPLPVGAAVPGVESSDETVLLLCGTHERNADTIIIARMSEGKTIRLLSVPRDIYYKGSKLNTHYRAHGMERLKNILGELTGLDFDGYISVDMYAFIDVINLLKGIEVTLEEPLIDPSYRVRVNGEWSTLYYPTGTHHLSGIEALRVVRSRHTSDDFDRSYRQQMVLKALLQRLNRVHAGKLKEIYDLFQILYRYVETDLTAYDMVQYYLGYHDATVEARKSVSTDNVLYTTYSNLYYTGLTEEEVDEDFHKGAWILLPKDGEWSLIKSFVREQLYGE
jgi:LCP family protein required for cell wall assembly